MGVRDWFSARLWRRAEKRGWFDTIANGNIRWNSKLVNDGTILQSSDVNLIVNDIANQVAAARPVVKNPDGSSDYSNAVLRTLKQPNDYLTGTEFSRLQTFTLLLNGEVYPILIGDQLHLVKDVMTNLDENLIEHFESGGATIPGAMIRHIKQTGTGWDRGVGLLELGKDTLDGVFNAEEVLNDKYKKGGLLAFLLKLDSVINPGNKNQTKLVKAITNQLDQVSTSGQTKMIPLGKGYEIDTLESPVKDDQVLNYLNVYKPDLGKFLGIDVGVYQSLMKTDVEKAMMYLNNKTVKPLLQNLADHYSLLFFGPNSGKRIEFEINPLDFVSYSTKTTIAYNMVRTSIMKPDDARLMVGLPALGTPESTTLYISKDLIPAKDAEAIAQSQVKAADEMAKPDSSSMSYSNTKEGD